MGKCYLCGKRVWLWQRRSWHSDTWGFMLIQDMGDDQHRFRICHEICVKDKVREMEKERLSRPQRHDFISREHNPPNIEFPDTESCGFHKKDIQDEFSTKKEDDLE